MAESHIASLISSTPDNDMSWGDDLRGAITTLADRMPVAAISNTRLHSSSARMLYFHPTATRVTMGADATRPKAAMAYVPTCTPSSVSIEVTTLGAAATGYVTLYKPDPTDGLPGVRSAQWGTFDLSATGVVTLTSQSQTVQAGWYWVTWSQSTATPFVRAINGQNQMSLFGVSGASSEGGAITFNATTAHPPPDPAPSTSNNFYTNDQYAELVVVMVA